MNLHEYFENNRGVGVLGTADSKGVVDTALYARPHMTGEKTCTFIMADKLSHKNVQENSHASYLFIEHGDGYKGMRLYLTKVKETEDAELAESLRRKKHGCVLSGDCRVDKSFVVEFTIDSIRPLVGDDKQDIEGICPSCQQAVSGSGHMCVPVSKKDDKCHWCGALIPDERHLCSDKVKELAYICNSCGRTAVKAENLCQPNKIK